MQLKHGLGLLSAALSLQAIEPAQAAPQPDEGVLTLKYLDYLDRQPGAERVRIKAPALALLAPFGSNWSLAAGAMVDSISGASPAYHTEALTPLDDVRRAYDLAFTRYGKRGTVTVGVAYSGEADYVSRSASVAATYASEDNNTTGNATLSVANDRINPITRAVSNERKHVVTMALGLTQVLTRHDVAQLLLGHVRGSGYFSDPYKIFDQRPRTRNNVTVLARWNHFYAASSGTSRLAYRYYRDSFGIRAHTLTAEYVQPLGQGWSLMPLARLYSQNAAHFYVPLDPDAAPFATNPPAGARDFSEDQRLSAFGGRTVGIKLAREFGLWQVDVKAERYGQRGDWRLGGPAPDRLPRFDARTWQLGVARRF